MSRSLVNVCAVAMLLSCGFACRISAADDTATAAAGAIDSVAGAVDAADWPWWRGPRRNGVADANQKPPLNWSKSENVIWRVSLPGRGHGAPIVVGDNVYIATADFDKQQQSLHCLQRTTGEVRWTRAVHSGGLRKKGNKKATLASTTPACDGRRVYVNFLNDGAVYTSALGLDGQVQWQSKITDYVVHQGYGSSPALYGNLVLVSADNKGGGAIAGLDRETGKIAWRHSRPRTPNYASPIVLRVSGRDQLMFIGCNLVSSFAPSTGKKLWEIKGATTECVTSTVAVGDLVFSSGGYPRNHIAAVRADGSGEVVWENNTRVYVPSMLARGDYLYAVADAGVAYCWEARTGKQMWKGRLGGTFSASPILAGDRIYATNERGATFVFKADPARFVKLAENRLGDEVLATAAICGGRVYMRVAHQTDRGRLEALYCLGEN